jgi:uncharacterized membrane protein YjgN (DUF898 family)
MFNGRCDCDLSMAECIGHAVLWIIISVLTLGIGAFIYPYALARFVVSRTYVVSGGRRVGRLQCDLDLGSQLGHLILWIILAVITFGLAYVVYLYRVGKLVADRTLIIPL